MFQLIKIQLEIFAPLQTLFPSLKIDIFCCIVPPISEYKMRAPEKNVPLQTPFSSLKIAIF